MGILYQARARVKFLRREEGGRRTPCFSGYRPQFYYPEVIDDWNDWCVHVFFDGWADPGETREAKLSFHSPEEHMTRVKVGGLYHLREGAKIVADVEILELGFPSLGEISTPKPA